MNAWRRGSIVLVATAWLVSAQAAQPAANDELFKAVSIDDLRDTRRLLQEHEADPHALDAHGDTILIAAIRNDAQHVVEYLIADRATDVDAVNVSQETALMIAAYRKQPGVVDELLARGAAVNRSGWTALHYAAAVDAGDIAAVLLKHGAAIDARSPNRTTPLMMAARGGFDALSRRLVDAGADPTATNERDLTASDFAKRASDEPLAQWLAGQATAWRASHGARDNAVK